MSVFTMQNLGRMGRWGNQVFQYMFVRTYAKRYGLEYGVSPWFGQLLYGHNDPRIKHQLPSFEERRAETKYPERHLAQAFPPRGDEVQGHDFVGYAQFHTSYYRPDVDYIRNLFMPREEVLQKSLHGLLKLRSLGNTIVGLHMRRGDTGRLIFYLTPNQWYLEWLDQHWSRFDKPVLFIASETPGDAAAFAKYNPVTAVDLMPLSTEPYNVYNYLLPDMQNPTPASMDWFPDWYFLTHCNVLAIGNSTFGFSAAMMGWQLRELWRSRLSTQTFSQIDPWDSTPLTYEDLRDHPGIPETWSDTNTKWDGGEVVVRA